MTISLTKEVHVASKNPFSQHQCHEHACKWVYEYEIKWYWRQCTKYHVGEKSLKTKKIEKTIVTLAYPHPPQKIKCTFFGAYYKLNIFITVLSKNIYYFYS